MDGVSCMGVTCSVMDEYSLDYFVRVKPVTLVQQIMLKLSTALFVPKLFMDSMFTRRDKNCLTMGKKKMTGIINASASKRISM